jgi:LysM repeat protein
MSTMTIHPTYAVRPARRSQAPAGRATKGQVRLTRRGRLAVFALMLAVVFAVALALSGQSTATGESGQEVRTERIVVAPGQTLWTIATEYADGGDVREAIDELEKLNALDTSMLYAGQELFVPVD